jgi:hypothetical protein
VRRVERPHGSKEALGRGRIAHHAPGPADDALGQPRFRRVVGAEEHPRRDRIDQRGPAAVAGQRDVLEVVGDGIVGRIQDQRLDERVPGSRGIGQLAPQDVGQSLVELALLLASRDLDERCVEVDQIVPLTLRPVALLELVATGITRGVRVVRGAGCLAVSSGLSTFTPDFTPDARAGLTAEPTEKLCGPDAAG